MNDADFATRVSAQVGALYADAKRSCHLFPANTLIQTRALASVSCDLFAAALSHALPPGLEAKIAELQRRRLINTHTLDLLQRLRRWGNSAAHPESSMVGADQFAGLAEQALAIALELIGTVFQLQHRGAAVPHYEVTIERPEEINQICYRALIENKPQDQFHVANQLLEQVEAALEEGRHDPNSVSHISTAQSGIDSMRARPSTCSPTPAILAMPRRVMSTRSRC